MHKWNSLSPSELLINIHECELQVVIQIFSCLHFYMDLKGRNNWIEFNIKGQWWGHN